MPISPLSIVKPACQPVWFDPFGHMFFVHVEHFHITRALDELELGFTEPVIE